MNLPFRLLTATFPLLCCAQSNIWAAPGPQTKAQTKAAPVKETAFTGATVRDKVRLRLQPDLNAKVVKDLGRGEFLLIVGEDNTFYRVKPDSDQKAYVYAKYVNDGKISGDRVNVRLQPDLEAPILVQMATGNQVTATAPPSADGWLEITVPDSVVFYVAKEYVEKVGDANYLANVRKQERELRQQMEFASNMGKTELQKPFESIDLTATRQAFKKALNLTGNQTDKRAHVQQLLQDIEQAYVAKREAYLSSRQQNLTPAPIPKVAPISVPKNSTATVSSALDAELNAYHAKLNQLDEKLNTSSAPTTDKEAAAQQDTKQSMAETLDRWSPVEGAYLVAWAERKGLSQASFDEFYAEQRQNARLLQGVLQPYSGQEKNKPGDFILIATDNTRRPLAYLYSTQVNLANSAGKVVRVIGLPRNNNQATYPAYFVLSLEK